MNSRTILVVEDEAPLLVLLKDILEHAGYAVLTAPDGNEAIDIYRRHRHEIALVFCDMALPRLGGWTVFLALKEINPDVKMILASAYLDPKVRSDMVKAGAKDFIPKPYMPEDVLTAIGTALEHPREQ
jgi:CheY-like chemotaxis protein